MASANCAVNTVQVRRENDPKLGYEFEEQMVLHAVLTLGENQALARETKFIDKFDDIALKDTRNNRLELYQLKHKQNPEQVITWNDLFSNVKQTKKNKSFYLIDYFDSYTRRDTASFLGYQITRLCFATNAGFVCPNKNPIGNKILSNLKLIFRNLSASQQKKTRGAQHQPKYYITDEDLGYYFEEESISKGIGTALIAKGKRYKFSDRGIQIITHEIRTHQQLSTFEEFLKLIVFSVGQPHAMELGEINRSLLRLYFPFHCGAGHQEQRFERVKKKVLALFKPVLGTSTANWATVSERKSSFEELSVEFKQDVKLGSIDGYEVNVLTDLYNQLHFNSIQQDYLNRIAPWVCVFDETLERFDHGAARESDDAGLLPIVNIFSNEFNATIITLKVLRTLRALTIEHKALLVQVNGAEGIKNIIVHLKELSIKTSPYNKDLNSSCERFYFVIEVSPFFKPAEDTQERINQLALELTTLNVLRKWIQFVILTEFPIEAGYSFISDYLQTIRDTPLEWEALPAAAKSYLFRKAIILEDNKITSLEALGLKEEATGNWMDSISLGELIVNSEERPLRLGLPKYDTDLSVTYIDRKIKIPLVSTRNMSENLKQRLVYNEEDFNKIITQTRNKEDNDSTAPTYHLLKPLDSVVVADSSYLMLWLKSNKTTEENYLELKDYARRADSSVYEIDESQLLMDNLSSVPFSADNKLAIIVDLPGKGKTFLLRSLTNQFLKQQSGKEKLDRLMFRINLPDVKASPSLWQDSSSILIDDEAQAVDFLIDNFLSLPCESSPCRLSRKLIKQTCIGNNSTVSASVFLLLDGFHEINDNQRSVVLRLTSHLLNAKGIKRIIVTSRPDNGLERVLIDHFMLFPLYMRNFEIEDQIIFLVKRWSRKLGDERESAILSAKGSVNQNEAINDIRKYAQELVKYSQKALKDEDRAFDIPLQSIIVSECFFDDLKLYLRKCQENLPVTNNLPEFQDGSFDLLRLYNQFYETKINVLLKEKARLQMEDNGESIFIMKQLKRTFSDAVSRLSVFHMMRNMSDAHRLCGMNWSTYRNKKYGDDLEQARRLGLIQGLDDSQPAIDKLVTPHVKFIHTTFAEYFFATFLLGKFLRSTSGLLDNDVGLPGADSLADATCKLLIEKIFIETEYAGVRRFIDRMLANRIPPHLGEQCPFAEKKRTSVIKEWPVTSDVKFNTHLAQHFVSHCSKMFETWQKSGDIDESDSNRLLKDNLKVFREVVIQPEGALFNLLLDKYNELPSISLLLMHCIKEYASRPSVANDEREALAHFVTLTSIYWAYFDSKTFKKDGNSRRKTSQLMQWYDPAFGLSYESNRIFSKWFLRLINKLCEPTSSLSELAALGSACCRVKYHRYAVPDYQDQVKTLFTSIFDASHWTIANDYLVVDTVSRDMEGGTRVLQGKNVDFQDVLALSTLVFPDHCLLKLQVDWFQGVLVLYLEWLNEGLRGGDLYYLKYINPFSLIETIEFLLKQLDELKPENYTETKQAIASRALDYVFKVLELFIEFLIWRRHLANNSEFPDLTMRSDDVIYVLLWYLMLSDQLIAFQTENNHSKRQVSLNIFFTAIGRSALISFADANCCAIYTQEKESVLFYFPSEMVNSEETRKTLFDDWFKDKLEIVWQGKTEREFIDFLFKNKMTLPVECTEQGRYELSALPCLLFSHMVSAYIPDRLSTNGLQYFEQVTRNVQIPIIEKSLWDCIMQQDLISSDSEKCTHKQEHIKIMRDKIQRKKQQLTDASM